MAWGQAYECLFEPGSDRKKALEVMQRVYSEDDPVYIRGEYSSDLIIDLKETLRPVISQPGSNERLIDGLTDSVFGPYRRYFASNRIFEFPESDPIVLLAGRGFDAVPAILTHLKDIRLTRSALIYGINNGISSGLARVGQSCAAYLAILSDGEIEVISSGTCPGRAVVCRISGDTIRRRNRGWKGCRVRRRIHRTMHRLVRPSETRRRREMGAEPCRPRWQATVRLQPRPPSPS